MFDIPKPWFEPMTDFRKKEVKPELKFKFMELYFVYALDANGYLATEKRVTDKEHLETCIKYAKHDWNVKKVQVNKAVMCFDGYLVQGDWKGEY